MAEAVRRGTRERARDRFEEARLLAESAQLQATPRWDALQRATRFVPTAPENYQGIRAAAESAGLLK